MASTTVMMEVMSPNVISRAKSLCLPVQIKNSALTITSFATGRLTVPTTLMRRIASARKVTLNVVEALKGVSQTTGFVTGFLIVLIEATSMIQDV